MRRCEQSSHRWGSVLIMAVPSVLVIGGLAVVGFAVLADLLPTATALVIVLVPVAREFHISTSAVVPRRPDAWEQVPFQGSMRRVSSGAMTEAHRTAGRVLNDARGELRALLVRQTYPWRRPRVVEEVSTFIAVSPRCRGAYLCVLDDAVVDHDLPRGASARTELATPAYVWRLSEADRTGDDDQRGPRIVLTVGVDGRAQLCRPPAETQLPATPDGWSAVTSSR